LGFEFAFVVCRWSRAALVVGAGFRSRLIDCEERKGRDREAGHRCPIVLRVGEAAGTNGPAEAGEARATLDAESDLMLSDT
jgi:hypothetical protein